MRQEAGRRARGHAAGGLQGPWSGVSGLLDSVREASATVGFLALGAATILARRLEHATRDVAAWILSRDQEGETTGEPVRHTLRILHGEFAAARPYEDEAGATHVIVYDQTTPHGAASLAHEFSHVLLAAIRGGPAKRDHLEECAAWALARAMTKGSIWGQAALEYRTHMLRASGVPAWACAPRTPPPTTEMLRWLAQLEP